MVATVRPTIPNTENENGTYTSPIEWLGPTEFVGFSEVLTSPKPHTGSSAPRKRAATTVRHAVPPPLWRKGMRNSRRLRPERKKGNGETTQPNTHQWLGSEGDNFPIYFIYIELVVGKNPFTDHLLTSWDIQS